MQTFVPYPDFKLTVRTLDRLRLGKQRLETQQLLTAIAGGSKGWVNHPAAKMWSAHTDALKAYGNECINEWVRRGYNNNMPLWEVPETYDMPWWWGWDMVHKSHRDNLFRKDAEHYSFFADADPNGPYIWPHKAENQYHIGNEQLIRMRR
jgi:hypothetical protein